MPPFGKIFLSDFDNKWYYWTGDAVRGPFESYALAEKDYYGKKESNEESDKGSR